MSKLSQSIFKKFVAINSFRGCGVKAAAPVLETGIERCVGSNPTIPTSFMLSEPCLHT